MEEDVKNNTRNYYLTVVILDIEIVRANAL